jgi:GPI mannosyltransferase 3
VSAVPPAPPPVPADAPVGPPDREALAEAPSERRLGWVLLWGVLALGAAFRLHGATHDDGIYWPDEVYQSLEPAHRLVYGYGLVAWEFVEGARNWALPGLVAGVLGLGRLLGLTDPAGYLPWVKGFFALVGTATAWATWRLSRAAGASTLAASGGAALFALASVPLYFAPRAMSENASVLPVVLGLALALPKGASRRALGAGASLLGLAVLLRLQNGVFCVGLLGVLLARRQWRDAGLALGVLAGWALAFGLLDKLTWGRWFHSAIVYLDFNLVQGKAAQWGTEPFDYYPRVLRRAMPVLSVSTGVLAVLALPRTWGLWVLTAAFVLLHAEQPHKELRFLVPVLPLFAALAGVGLDSVLRVLRGTPARATATVAVVAGALVSGASAGTLTFGDLGQYEQVRPKDSAWDDQGAVNRLLEAAGRRDDVCGLKVEVVHLAWTGGYSYFHRKVPLYPHNGPPRNSRRYSHVLTARGYEGPATPVAEEGSLVLAKLPDATCAPDPGYSWRLP